VTNNAAALLSVSLFHDFLRRADIRRDGRDIKATKVASMRGGRRGSGNNAISH